jgi:Uma2 family endonuclease
MAVAIAVKKWTLRDLNRLPRDGNTYELIDGELFVTPPPSFEHETIAARLSSILTRYVDDQGLGLVYHPRAVVLFRGSQVEPDLMVVKPPSGAKGGWAKAPLPSLIVEIHSPYTWRRDQEQKREHYRRKEIPEYWMIDPEERTLTVVRVGMDDVVIARKMTNHPEGAAEPLSFDVRRLFT